MVIDIHSHVLLGVDDGWLVRSGLFRPLPDGSALAVLRGIPMHAAEDLLSTEKQTRVADEAGVSLRILSSVESVYLLSRYAGRRTLDVARRVNDAMAALVAESSGRLAGMASVDPFDATHVDELERAVGDLRLTGVCVPSSWDGRYLDSGLADPFFGCAEAMGTPVFIHPPLVPPGNEAMEQYRLVEVVGRVFDTTVSIARMIYAGVFDRFPGLNVVVPHMGAALTSVMGRLDMGYRLGYAGHTPYQTPTCERKPSEYFGNLYVDTMGFSPATLKLAIEVFGPSRVLFGTDYPAVPISPAEHIALVESLDLSAAAREAVFHRNAFELFGLERSTAQKKPTRAAPDLA